VRRAGYAPIAFDRRIGPGFEGSQDFQLNPAAVWDALEAASGWTVGAAADNATAGVWTRVAPTGTGAAAGSFASANHSLRATSGHTCGAFDGPSASGGEASASVSGSGMACSAHSGVRAVASATGEGAEEPIGHCGCGTACLCAKASAALGEVQPGSDHTPGGGTQCLITGQSTNGTPEGGDVDGGRTTLTSPAFDMSGLSGPVIGFWRWFYTNGDANDWLATLISDDNGATWVPVDTTRGLHNEWQEQAIQVADYVTPTSQVRIRFVAADLGPESVVEAAVDDVVAYDGSLALVSVGPVAPPARMTFRAPRPNPARGTVMIELELSRAEAVTVELFDLSGRRVRRLHRGSAPVGVLSMAWDGLDDGGRAVAEGIYYARATAGTQQMGARVAIVR
jgi:hypothetical protein